MDTLDLFVIGGGVNGAGIIRDAVGRGLKVALCERGDFAGATSSASSKLIHGGLRYLEHYEFRLVAEALAERERLLKICPHIAWPMRFVLPHSSEQRPAWMLRAGLVLYDSLHLLYGVRRSLPGSVSLRFAGTPQGAPLKTSYTRGFEYSDAWVDDARLVILNLMDARARGAQILPRTEFLSAEPVEGNWRLKLRNADGEFTLNAKSVINAAGPWVGQAASQRGGGAPKAGVQLVKGSHIVVRRLFDGPHAYILQNDDKRIVFMIPYEHDFTLIGTTDLRASAEELSSNMGASAAEIEYLCKAVNRYLASPINPAHVIYTYAGVRPLYDDGSANPSETTRDYVFKRADHVSEHGTAPWLDIFGGKITTFRYLAQEALDHFKPHLPHMGAAWSAGQALPGGDLSGAASFTEFLAQLHHEHAALPARWLADAAHRHGSLIHKWLGSSQSMAALGADLGGGLTEAEAEYMKREEWAESLTDMLWRRSKCGLRMKLAEAQ